MSPAPASCRLAIIILCHCLIVGLGKVSQKMPTASPLDQSLSWSMVPVVVRLFLTLPARHDFFLCPNLLGRSNTRSPCLHLLLITQTTPCIPLSNIVIIHDHNVSKNSLAEKAELTDGLPCSAGNSTNSFADSSSLSSCELG